MLLHNFLSCANCFYIAIRVVRISNLILIQNSLQFIEGFENRKHFPFPPSMLGHFLRPAHSPFLFSSLFSRRTAFPVHPRMAHLVAQWPAPAHPNSFVLTTLAEVEPSTHAAAFRAPLPLDVAPTLTLPACTCDWHGLLCPVCTPPPPYPFGGDFEPKQNGKKLRIKFMSNPQQTLQEFLIQLKELFVTLFHS
jgi:hypothetical protein